MTYFVAKQLRKSRYLMNVGMNIFYFGWYILFIDLSLPASLNVFLRDTYKEVDITILVQKLSNS